MTACPDFQQPDGKFNLSFGEGGEGLQRLPSPLSRISPALGAGKLEEWSLTQHHHDDLTAPCPPSGALCFQGKCADGADRALAL